MKTGYENKVFVATDFYGNVMLVDQVAFLQFVKEHKDKTSMCAVKANMKTLNEIIRSYRKGEIELGDKRWLTQ